MLVRHDMRKKRGLGGANIEKEYQPIEAEMLKMELDEQVRQNRLTQTRAQSQKAWITARTDYDDPVVKAYISEKRARMMLSDIDRAFENGKLTRVEAARERVYIMKRMIRMSRVFEG